MSYSSPLCYVLALLWEKYFDNETDLSPTATHIYGSVLQLISVTIEIREDLSKRLPGRVQNMIIIPGEA